MVGQRVFGIALGYEDLIDHDELRHDPMMAVLAGKLAARREDCAPVAGKSTLNRLELGKPQPTPYHKIGHDPAAIRKSSSICSSRLMPARRGRSFSISMPPTIRCMDTRGSLLPRYYDCYCYLPLYIFCGRDLLAAKLRRPKSSGSRGGRRSGALVAHIRARWPRVRILLRADSGLPARS